jgi:glutathione S-transferase
VTYRLYNRRGSGGYVVEAALALAGAPYELQELDSKAGTPLPESFRAINPWRQVPALVLPDGTLVTETSAILIHLANRHPEQALAPAPGTSEHAAFLRWLVFANVNVYEAVLRRGYPSRYTTGPDGHEGVSQAAIRRMGEALEVLEGAIAGPFLQGERMTVADVYIAMLCAWHRGRLDAPRLDRLRRRVGRDPIVGPIWQHHFGHRDP